MDRGAWQGRVPGVSKSRTRLSDLNNNTGDLQCCVRFRCTTKLFHYYILMYILKKNIHNVLLYILFHCSSLQDIDYR